MSIALPLCVLFAVVLIAAFLRPKCECEDCACRRSSEDGPDDIAGRDDQW